MLQKLSTIAFSFQLWSVNSSNGINSSDDCLHTRCTQDVPELTVPPTRTVTRPITFDSQLKIGLCHRQFTLTPISSRLDLTLFSLRVGITSIFGSVHVARHRSSGQLGRDRDLCRWHPTRQAKDASQRITPQHTGRTLARSARGSDGNTRRHHASYPTVGNRSRDTS